MKSKKKAVADKAARQRDIGHYCQAQAIKLTPLRQKILDIISVTTQPMTAYAILEELQKDNPKAQVMSVYRILDYFLQHGVIHRIENLNAFMPCSHLFEHHVSQWLICRACGEAKECALSVFNQGICEVEQQTGFSVSSSTIELIGLCPNCQQLEAANVAATESM